MNKKDCLCAVKLKTFNGYKCVDCDTLYRDNDKVKSHKHDHIFTPLGVCKDNYLYDAWFECVLVECTECGIIKWQHLYKVH